MSSDILWLIGLACVIIGLGVGATLLVKHATNVLAQPVAPPGEEDTEAVAMVDLTGDVWRALDVTNGDEGTVRDWIEQAISTWEPL